jgi:formyltetrahydrofolate synthetase
MRYRVAVHRFGLRPALVAAALPRLYRVALLGLALPSLRGVAGVRNGASGGDGLAAYTPFDEVPE